MWCENCLNCQTISLYLFIFSHCNFNICLIAKMDSSQHTVLTDLIMFSYQTVVNIYKKILKENAHTN